MKDAEAILQRAKTTGALVFGEFKLSSGKIGSYYFDGRLLTLDPEGSNRVASALLPILKKCDAQAIAGPTIGADPIVASVAVLSYQAGHPIPGLIVRAEAKKHGKRKLIEGPITKGARVAIVDDTVTSGRSLIKAIEAIEEAGCVVAKVICILDRREGGSEEIKRRGYAFTALLEADENGRITATSR